VQVGGAHGGESKLHSAFILWLAAVSGDAVWWETKGVEASLLGLSWPVLLTPGTSAFVRAAFYEREDQLATIKLLSSSDWASTMSQLRNPKRHDACDECRMSRVACFSSPLTLSLQGTRKLKCSGSLPTCERCSQEHIRCVYSPRKQMGRPRKRRRENENAGVIDANLSDQHPGLDEDGNEFASPSLHGFDPTVPSGKKTSALDFHQDVDPTLFPHLSSELGNSELNLAINSSTSSDLHGTESEYLYLSPPSTHGSVPLAPCACLSEMYLTLSILQVQSTFDFPNILPILRSALSTTTSVLTCEQCPKQTMTAMQNVMLLTTLLTTITDGYRKLIRAINAEADRVRETGEIKKFRVGDSTPERMHMHTGTVDCPMGFDIELDYDEWRKLACKVVKADLEGSQSGTASILGLADMLAERQKRWHSNPIMEQSKLCSTNEACGQRDGGFSCLTMIEMVKRHVEGLGL
jgi:hypothetical protein